MCIRDSLKNPLDNTVSYGDSEYWRRVVLHKKAYVPARTWLSIFSQPPKHGSVYKVKFLDGGEQENETSSGLAIQYVAEYSEKWYDFRQLPLETLDSSKTNDNVPVKPKHRQRPIPDDMPKSDIFYGSKPRCVGGKIMYDTPLDSDSKIDESLHNTRKGLIKAETTYPDVDDFYNNDAYSWLSLIHI